MSSKPNTTQTGLKDRRITIETWSTSQDAGGGQQGTVAGSYQIWANVESKSGQLIKAEGGREWPYNFKMTMRYEKSRPVTVDQTVTYDGQRFNINYVNIVREGMRMECIIGCSTTTKL